MAFEPLTYLLDFSTPDFDKLEDPAFTLQLLKEITVLCDFQVLSCSYKKFEPQGITAMLLLGESHISIHTWPERALFCVDIFTCKGKININAIHNFLQQQLTNLHLLQLKEISRRSAPEFILPPVPANLKVPVTRGA